MRSTIIDAGSKQTDVWGLLQGTWNEYDVKVGGESEKKSWHVVKTPFFLILSATCDAGGYPLPFKFNVPVCGILYYGDGSVSAAIVRPGENSINVSKKCIAKFQLFGNEADVAAVI